MVSSEPAGAALASAGSDAFSAAVAERAEQSPKTFFHASSPVLCASGAQAYVSSSSVPEYTENDERPLARKYGKRWSTCTGTSANASPSQRNAAICAGSTPVRASGGTTSVPLCAWRTL